MVLSHELGIKGCNSDPKEPRRMSALGDQLLGVTGAEAGRAGVKCSLALVLHTTGNKKILSSVF